MPERRFRGTDILVRLKAAAHDNMRPGTGDSDVNVFAQPIIVTYGHIAQAIQEIERLRGIIRSCVHGTERVYLGDGEVIGLHLPNKTKE
jgi:hypothetical protein